MNPFFAALGFPILPAAACRSRHELYDRVVDEGGSADTKAALEICDGCLELDACHDWLESLPKKLRPLGVTAGQLHGVPGRRRRKERSA